MTLIILKVFGHLALWSVLGGIERTSSPNTRGGENTRFSGLSPLLFYFLLYSSFFQSLYSLLSLMLDNIKS